MKTLGEIDKIKDGATARASDIGRQLALAGLAVIWIARESALTPIASSLIAPLLGFVVFLAFDLMQYIWCSIIWTVFYLRHEGVHKSDESRVDIPAWINRPTYLFFWLKLAALLAAWIWLGVALAARWKLFQGFSGMEPQMVQAISAVAAIIVSLVAVWIAVWTTITQRTHNRLSVRPLAEILLLDAEGHLRVRLRNHGVGPLLIQSLRVIQPGMVPLESLVEAMPEEPGMWRFFVGPIDGRSIAVGNEIDLIELAYDSSVAIEHEQAVAVRAALSTLDIEVVYQDIYGKPMPKYVRSLSWFGRTLANGVSKTSS